MTGVEHWKEEGGKRLARARREKQLTLKELSNLLGGKYSTATLHGYEKGRRGMTPDTAARLGSLLGVSAAYLLCVEPSSDELQRRAKEIAEAREFMTQLRMAPRVVQEIVWDILAKHGQGRVIPFPKVGADA